MNKIWLSLIKVKFSTSRYKKKCVTKKMQNYTFKCSKLFYFKNKILFWKRKMQKTVKKCNIHKSLIIIGFLPFFHSIMDFFLKIKKFGTFKCKILHLFCNTHFFVSWSWKFDCEFWLNLPVQCRYVIFEIINFRFWAGVGVSVDQSSSAGCHFFRDN